MYILLCPTASDYVRQPVAGVENADSGFSGSYGLSRANSNFRPPKLLINL
jgi:hypothetical protein